MNGLYVQAATLLMEGLSDPAAPGAAITVALCGSSVHPPPCPLAPHYTGLTRKGDGGEVELRIIFSTPGPDEDEVRRRIDEALAQGSHATPGGAVSRWTLLASGPGELSTAEREHALRISGA